MEEVITLHADVLGIPIDKAGHYLLGRGRLESALARPRQCAIYENADLFGQAATLLWGLIQDHPFIDGNKRTAWISTRDFLAVNGSTIEATIDERADVVIGIAERRFDVSDADEWIRQHVTERRWRRSWSFDPPRRR